MNIISTGPDWYTATNILDDHPKQSSLYHLFEEISVGHRKWNGGGYKGSECLATKIKYGSRIRTDGRADEILIASGKSSEIAIDHLGNPDRFRATRLDLQMTIKLETRDETMASDLYANLRRRRELGTSPIGNRKMTLMKSETGETLYLGSRSSGKKFFRLYDKSFDMDHFPGKFWRAEVQYGRDLASGALRWLDSIGDDEGAIIDLICSEFYDAMGWAAISEYQYRPQDFPPLDRKPTTLEGKLNWLTDCVRPTVILLTENGLESQAREALGLPVNSAWARRTTHRSKLKE